MPIHDVSIDPTGRYTLTAIVLHWLLSVMLAAQVGLGWYMLSVEHQPGSEKLFALHISAGLTIALLVVLRMAWRAAHPPAALPASAAPWEVKAARISHILLYVVMVLLPVTGYLGVALSGHAVSYFGLPLPGWAAKNGPLKEQLFTVHSVIAWVLVALVSAHVLGALKHLLKDRDGVFHRMWPR